MNKKRRQPTAEQIETARLKRAELSAICKPIVTARKAGLFPFALLPTVNACLEMMYSAQTGQKEWGTFHTWKKRGFMVKKGEKGFSIWGRPIEADGKQHDAGEALAEGTDSEDKFSFFPLSHIFHAGQVADANGNPPRQNLVAVALFNARTNPLPLALPAPVTL
jgi:hypothetical protein